MQGPLSPSITAFLPQWGSNAGMPARAGSRP